MPVWACRFESCPEHQLDSRHIVDTGSGRIALTGQEHSGMKGFVNRRYLTSTLLLIIALIGYFSFSQYLSGPRANRAVGQTDGPPASDGTQPSSDADTQQQPQIIVKEDPSPEADSNQNYLWLRREVLAIVAILVVATLLMILLAKLQRRRREAYQKAAMQQRDQSRTDARAKRQIDSGKNNL